MVSILHDITGSIQQAVDLLEGLPPELYTKTYPPAYESPIGAHLRHNIDHYHSFCQGLANGEIDYDHRCRDPRLERDLPLAISILRGVMADLSELDGEDLDRSVRVKMDCGDQSEWSQSSLKRELQFLLSHTVHHYAIIAIVCRSEGHALPHTFGVAPSTLKFREAQEKTLKACAP